MSLGAIASEIYREHLTPDLNQDPRRKCCTVCAFRQGDPQGIRAADDWDQTEFDLEMGLLEFYCSHTVDDRGRNQVCAGYQSLYGRHVSALEAAP